RPPFTSAASTICLHDALPILARRLTEKSQRMHEGVWDKSAKGSHEVRGRTLGIVGYGNIGTQLSNVAEAIGMRVIFFDTADRLRSEEHTSELQSRFDLVCRLL